MFIYITVWLLLLVLLSNFINYNCDENRHKLVYKKNIIIFSAMIYIVFASFRDVTLGIGVDMENYYYYFQSATIGFKEFCLNSTCEIGYTILEWIVKNTVNKFSVFLLVCYSIIFISYYSFLKETKWNRYRYMTLAVIILDLFSAFYIIRMGLSVSMGLMMIKNMYYKKYKKAFIYLILALSFHNSAMILLPVILFNYILDKKEKFSKRKMIFLLTISLIFTLYLTQYMDLIFENSIKYNIYHESGSISYGVDIISIFILALSIFRYKELEKKSKFSRTLITSLCVVFLVIPLQLKYEIMYRSVLFFLPLIYILLMLLQEVYRKSRWYIVIRLISLAYFFHQIYSFFTKSIYFIGIPYVFRIGL